MCYVAKPSSETIRQEVSSSVHIIKEAVQNSVYSNSTIRTRRFQHLQNIPSFSGRGLLSKPALR